MAAKPVRNFCFTGNAQPLGRRSGGYDQRFGLDSRIVYVKRERTFLKIYAVYPGLEELGAESFRLFAKLHHQVRTLNAFGETGIILDIRSDH